jgi:hypothetical protein
MNVTSTVMCVDVDKSNGAFNDFLIALLYFLLAHPCPVSKMIMRPPYLMNHHVIHVYLLPQNFTSFLGLGGEGEWSIKTNGNVNQ